MWDLATTNVRFQCKNSRCWWWEQGCQMAYFQNKKYLFGLTLEGLAMWIVGIFYGQFVYFKVIWYILWQFGIFCGNLVFFVAIWYILWLCSTKKNLATMDESSSSEWPGTVAWSSVDVHKGFLTQQTWQHRRWRHFSSAAGPQWRHPLSHVVVWSSPVKVRTYMCTLPLVFMHTGANTCETDCFLFDLMFQCQ
jgi:hypothetical protein